MVIVYNKILKAYMCFSTCRTYGSRALLACKVSRTEALCAGLSRL